MTDGVTEYLPYAEEAAPCRRYRAGQGSNETIRTMHALVVRPADRSVPNGVSNTDQLTHAEGAGTAR